MRPGTLRMEVFVYKSNLTLRTIRFAVSGSISLGTYFLLYITCTELGIHYLLSATIGFLGYWSSNFFLHKTWTFNSRGNTKKQALLHMSMHSVNFCLNLAGLTICVEWLHMHYVSAQAVLTIIFTVEVFFVSHYIFRE